MLDSETTKGIITFFGIHGQTAETFASYGIKGVFYALLFFIVKALIKKFLWDKIQNWLSDINKDKNKHIDVLNDIKAVLEVHGTLLKQSIEDNKLSHTQSGKVIAECRERLDRQGKNIDILLEDACGELDKRLSINMTANYFEKMNYRLSAFFRNRIEQNHIKGNEEVIKNKYLSYAQRTAPKIEAQFSSYTHKGVPLVNFFGDGGAYFYLERVLMDLFELQKSTMLGNKNNIVEFSDIDSHLEHLVSYMIGAITRYCEDGTTYIEYYDLVKMPRTVIMTEKEIKDIEFLISDIKEKDNEN